jgi:hypothetical protein
MVPEMRMWAASMAPWSDGMKVMPNCVGSSLVGVYLKGPSATNSGGIDRSLESSQDRLATGWADSEVPAGVEGEGGRDDAVTAGLTRWCRVKTVAVASRCIASVSMASFARW